MKVNELIKKLKAMPQDAEVYIEAYSEPDANDVRLYADGVESLVYIGDNFAQLDSDMIEQGFQASTIGNNMGESEE